MISLSKLHTEEDFGFLKLVEKETANLPLTATTTGEADIPEVMSDTAETTGEAAVLDVDVETFKVAYKAFDDALKTAATTETSAELIAADEERDDAWLAAYRFVKTLTAHPTAETAKIARQIKATFDKYGNPTGLSRTEESGVLHNLLQDLSALTTEERTATGFSPWLTRLEDAETSYLDLLAVRTAEKAGVVTGLVKITRQTADKAYRALVNTVNALIIVNGITPYETFTDNMNVHIARLKTVLKARQTKADNAAAGATTTTPDAPTTESDAPVVSGETAE